MSQLDLLARVIKLHQLFQEGKIPTLPNHEVHPDVTRESRENYLYFTLPVCINFQRSSPAMWASALKTYEDPLTNYLFFPEEVALRSREQVQKDLVKHKLALQPNKHTDIWLAISHTLHEFYDNDPREVLKTGQSDVAVIIPMIQKEHKKRFPYLSGAKMTNYWLYILSHYTDVRLQNMHEISIIPDTHVLQSTVKLGILTEANTPETVAMAWRELLRDSSLTPVEMHPVLWNWSRNNFQPEV